MAGLIDSLNFGKDVNVKRVVAQGNLLTVEPLKTTHARDILDILSKMGLDTSKLEVAPQPFSDQSDARQDRRVAFHYSVNGSDYIIIVGQSRSERRELEEMRKYLG